MFDRYGHIVFEHSDTHSGIISALAFDMVEHIPDLIDRVRDDLTASRKVLIPYLTDWLILPIRGTKHLVDQWDDKLYQVETLGKMYRKIMEDGDCLSVKDLAVNGHDLMNEGFKMGPEMGKVLHDLLEHVLDDPSMNDKQKLLEVLHGKR